MIDQENTMEELRAAIRDEGHLVTPYRLGLKVGSRGLDLPCPYVKARSVKLYREGVSFGRSWHQPQRGSK